MHHCYITIDYNAETDCQIIENVTSRDRSGVGILFSSNIEGALLVADVVKGGPSDRSGLVKRGE